jgi:hypothetical protein
MLEARRVTGGSEEEEPHERGGATRATPDQPTPEHERSPTALLEPAGTPSLTPKRRCVAV